jgi:hypothetical protein
MDWFMTFLGVAALVLALATPLFKWVDEKIKWLGEKARWD